MSFFHDKEQGLSLCTVDSTLANVQCTADYVSELSVP